MRIIFVFACLWLMGCASTTTVYEVSVGYNTGDIAPWGSSAADFAGPMDVANLAVTWEHASGRFCEVRHTSHLTAGRPFNSKEEDVLDSINCGYRLRKRR